MATQRVVFSAGNARLERGRRFGRYEGGQLLFTILASKGLGLPLKKPSRLDLATSRKVV